MARAMRRSTSATSSNRDLRNSSGGACGTSAVGVASTTGSILDRARASPWPVPTTVARRGFQVVGTHIAGGGIVGWCRRLVRLGACALAAPLVLASCYTCYTGTARDISAPTVAADRSWVVAGGVPVVRQKSDRDCRAAALVLGLSRWEIPMTIDQVVSVARPGRAGIRIGVLRDLARRQGMQAFVTSGSLASLSESVARGWPVVVGVAKPVAARRTVAHYEVVVGF